MYECINNVNCAHNPGRRNSRESCSAYSGGTPAPTTAVSAAAAAVRANKKRVLKLVGASSCVVSRPARRCVRHEHRSCPVGRPSRRLVLFVLNRARRRRRRSRSDGTRAHDTKLGRAHRPPPIVFGGARRGGRVKTNAGPERGRPLPRAGGKRSLRQTPTTMTARRRFSIAAAAAAAEY